MEREAVEYGEVLGRDVVLTRRAARWQHPGAKHWELASVAVGQLPDGRWWVEWHCQINTPARAYSSKRHAWFVARNLMLTRQGPWETMPVEGGIPRGYVAPLYDPRQPGAALGGRLVAVPGGRPLTWDQPNT